MSRLRLLLESVLPEAVRDALIGDIEEEYASGRHSRTWLWRQLLLAVIHSLRLERPIVQTTKGEGLMQTILQDIHYAFRLMVKKPGFTLITVCTLAIGVAMNASIFSVVNAVLIRPLAYEKPDAIFTVWQNNTKEGIAKDAVSPANFIDWHARNSSFERLAAVRPWEIQFQQQHGTQLIKSSLVTKGYFELMGVEPLLGRSFADEDFPRGARPTIVISHGLWRRMFSGDPSIVGKTVRTADGDVTVIGVMPPGFSHPDKLREAWGPFEISGGMARQRASTYLGVVGRPKSGLTLDQVRVDMGRVTQQLAQEFPNENEGVGGTVVTLPEHVIGDVRLPLSILMFSVSMLLFIACLNVANFMLVRGSQRSQEFAVRTALGARRGRLFRQLLVEAVSISAAGSAVGLLTANWVIRIVPQFTPADFPRIDEVSLDLNVVLFTLGVAFAAAVVFAAAPALQVLFSRVSPASRPTFGVGATSAGRRMRHAVIVVQVALALVLLVGAGLLSRSFINLLNVDPGFSRSNILTTELHIWDRFPRPQQQSQFFDDLTNRLRSLPGVQAVGAASAIPFIGEASIEIDTVFRVEGSPESQSPKQAYLTMATPGYFQAMGIPLIDGRVFEDQDSPVSAPVAVITEGIARRYWTNENPVGKRIFVRDDDRNPNGDQMVALQIVGVVGDVQHTRLDDARRDEIFVPHRQRPFGSMMLVTRTSGDPSLVAESLRSEVLALNPSQNFGTIATIQELIGRTLVTPRFYLVLIGAFASTALILAIAGVYGVISLSTVQRTREIGLRISLGAVSSDILTLILRQGLTLVGAGVAMGLVASLVVTRFLTTLLFQVTATDFTTFAGVSFLLLAVAAIACYLPARRAAKIDPVNALRFE